MNSGNEQASDMLAGVKVLEFSAIGPVPWGVSLLAEMGATVTRICRPNGETAMPTRKEPDDFSERGRHDVFLDLKTEEGRAQARELISTHDILIEGMRPGVMERLELGPACCESLNPALVYGRVTGWGQEGPLAVRAGHDINYIALSGALHAIGPKEGPPVIPLNLVGDYGGGGTFMVMGVLGALIKARSTGKGSVVDVAMLDGAARQMGLAFERYGRKEWIDERGSNLLDGGAPWYSVYPVKCGGYMAVGAIESAFYTQFVQGLGLDEKTLPDRSDKARWGQLRDIFQEQFLTRTRAQWTEIYDPLDACVSPVLSLQEAPQHPHNLARQTFVSAANASLRPASAPRFTGLGDTKP